MSLMYLYFKTHDITVEGYDDDEPAEPEELPFDPEESQSEAQR